MKEVRSERFPTEGASAGAHSADWFVAAPARPRARVRLIAFPYAGAGTSIFRGWHELLPKDVEVCAAQLPGRETRLREPACRELPPLVEALAGAIDVDRPCCFFGHSFGALVAFAVAHHLMRLGLPGPQLLLLSGRPAPQLESRHPPIHHLPRTEFLDMIAHRYGALPAALIGEPELLDLVLPALQADIGIVERQRFEGALLDPLRVPIVAYGGLSDPLVHKEELAAWRARTSDRFALEMFDGDHFYLNQSDSRRQLLTSITRAMNFFF